MITEDQSEVVGFLASPSAYGGASVERIVRTTGRTPEEARKALEAASPQRRLMRPEEVAGAVAWLCSDDAAGVSGQAIVVNGG